MMKDILCKGKTNKIKKKVDELYDDLYGYFNPNRNKNIMTNDLSVARTLFFGLFRPKVSTQSTMGNWTMNIPDVIRQNVQGKS